MNAEKSEKSIIVPIPPEMKYLMNRRIPDDSITVKK